MPLPRPPPLGAAMLSAYLVRLSALSVFYAVVSLPGSAEGCSVSVVCQRDLFQYRNWFDPLHGVRGTGPPWSVLTDDKHETSTGLCALRPAYLGTACSPCQQTLSPALIRIFVCDERNVWCRSASGVWELSRLESSWCWPLALFNFIHQT